MQIVHFIKAFIKNPAGVSTIFPASSSLAKSMSKNSDVSQSLNIVEIGVGTGALTEALLKDMSTEHSYTGFEIDLSFYKFLNKDFKTKHYEKIKSLKHFEFRSESAELLSNYFAPESVDVVVSSLPWSIFDPNLQNSILDEIQQVLKPNGVFSFYNYVSSSQFNQIKVFKSEIQKRFSSLQAVDRVWLNFPPATVWVARK